MQTPSVVTLSRDNIFQVQLILLVKSRWWEKAVSYFVSKCVCKLYTWFRTLKLLWGLELLIYPQAIVPLISNQKSNISYLSASIVREWSFLQNIELRTVPSSRKNHIAGDGTQYHHHCENSDLTSDFCSQLIWLVSKKVFYHVQLVLGSNVIFKNKSI
jgi:hypothetical protein